MGAVKSQTKAFMGDVQDPRSDDELLKDLCARELELKQELDAIRLRRQAIERRKMKSSTPQSIVTIEQLPLEILILIFRLSIQDRQARIGRLLLVSKFWNQVVVSTPTLWTHIEVEIWDEEFNRPTALSYVRACHAYSGNQPLDVDIIMDDPPSPGVLYRAACEHLNNLVETHELFSDFPLRIVDRLGEERFQDRLHLGHDIYRRVYQHSVKLAEELASCNYRHMRRWRRATVLVPSGAWIGESIDTAAMDTFRALGWMHPNISTTTNHPCGNLVDLTLNGLGYLPSGALPQSLRKLWVKLVQSTDQLAHITSLDELEDLRLELDEPWTGPLHFHLELSKVQRLALVCYSGPMPATISTGPLQQLCVKGDSELEVIEHKAKCLDWEFEQITPETTADPTRALCSAIASVGSAMELTIRGFKKTTIDQVVRDASFPVTLRSLKVELADQAGYTIQLKSGKPLTA